MHSRNALLIVYAQSSHVGFGGEVDGTFQTAHRGFGLETTAIIGSVADNLGKSFIPG